MVDLPPFFKEEISKSFVLQLKTAREKCERCKRQGIIRDDNDHSYFDCPDCVGKLNSIRQYIYANIRDPQFNRLRRDDIRNYLSEKCWTSYLTIYNSIIKILEMKNVIIAKTTSDLYGVSPAAVVLLKKLIFDKQPSFMVKFDTLVETFFAFRDTTRNAPNPKDQMLEFYRSVPYLLIENFGDDFVNPKGSKDDFITQKLMQFLKSRQNCNGKTILSFGISDPAFHKKYDEQFKMFISENYLTFILETTQAKTQVQEDVDDLRKLFVTKKKPVKITVQPKKAL